MAKEPTPFELDVAHLRERLAPYDGSEIMSCMRFAPRAVGGGVNAAFAGWREREPRLAAVMMLFIDRASGVTVLLTERRSDLRQHAGEIALPGGRVEAGETLQQAALREVEEEIGLGGNDVEVWGRLDGVYVPPSNFLVTPFTGLLRRPGRIRADPREVNAIIEIPVAALLDGRLVRHEVAGGREMELFAWEGRRIWGATARMLNNLREALGVPCEPWHRSD